MSNNMRTDELHLEELLRDEVETKNEVVMQLLETQQQLEDSYLAQQNLKHQLSSQHKNQQEEVGALTHKNIRSQAEVASLTHRLTQCEKQLENMHNSLYWRIFSPIRRITRRFKYNRNTNEQLVEDKALLENSDYFDADWYLAMYADVKSSGDNPVEHYLLHGAAEGRQPSEKFDTLGYLAANPDVLEIQVNPLVHFLRFGQHEGRLPNPSRSS